MAHVGGQFGRRSHLEKVDSIDFNKHVHDIDIFINDKWRKYAGGERGRLFKITRGLELSF
jgi:hypothetical protein